MKKITFIIYITAVFSVCVSGQEKSVEKKIDSINAVLTQLKGNDKLNALAALINLTSFTTPEKYYTKIYLEEAKLLNDTVRIGWALSALTGMYYSQYDSDSLFIYGKESLLFNRKHKLYDYLFATHREIIRRYKVQNQIITAMRKTEEAYEEAKQLHDDRAMSAILAAMGNLYYTMEQYEDAVRYHIESNEAAAKKRLPNESTFIINYDYLAYLGRMLNRWQDILLYADSMHVEIDRLHKNVPDKNVQIYYYFEQYHRALAYAGMKQPKQAW